MLDDRDLDAGRLEQVEALPGVTQQWRRRARDDLVGVVVEGEDGRPGRATLRLAHELLQEVAVSEVEAIEDADHDEQAPQRGLERVEALDDRHRPVFGVRAHRWRIFVGAIRAPSRRPRPTSTPASSNRPNGDALLDLTNAGRRADEPTLARIGDLRRCQGHGRHRVEAGIHREEQATDALRAV